MVIRCVNCEVSSELWLRIDEVEGWWLGSSLACCDTDRPTHASSVTWVCGTDAGLRVNPGNTLIHRKWLQRVTSQSLSMPSFICTSLNPRGSLIPSFICTSLIRASYDVGWRLPLPLPMRQSPRRLKCRLGLVSPPATRHTVQTRGTFARLGNPAPGTFAEWLALDPPEIQR